MDKQTWQKVNKKLLKCSQPTHKPMFKSSAPQLKSLEQQQKRRSEAERLCQIKIDMLSRKLRHKTNQSTMQLSRLTHSNAHLKDSKIPQLYKSITIAGEVSRLKCHKQRMQANKQQQIDNLSEAVQVLIERSKMQLEGTHNKYETNIEKMQNIQILLGQIKDKAQKLQNVKKQFVLYRDLLKRPFNLKTSSIYNEKYRKETISSVFKQGSLLLSFKKNIDEDDGYTSLKYSQQSANIKKNRQKQSEPIFESFSKDSKIKVNKRLSFKEQMQQTEGEVVFDCFELIKQHTCNLFEQHNNRITDQYKQAKTAQNNFEQILDSLIQQIAQQKVQNELHYKEIINQTSDEFLNIETIISNIKMMTMSFEYKLQERFQEIQEKVGLALKREIFQRKDEEKLMIKMMMQVVQYLQ